MKKITYDYIIVTNVPAFYKIKLYNELAKKLKIKVIFCSNSSSIRPSDFCSGDLDFEHEFLFSHNFENRNKFVSLFKLAKILLRDKFKLILFPSWELIEFIPLMLLLTSEKLGMVLESSIIETKTTGIHWLIKKLVINKMGHAFPSGKLQSDILLKANYKGLVHITHGVGLPSRKATSRNATYGIRNYFRYLYVGRVSSEKNIEHLVELFNNNGKNLTVVGDGPLLESLSSIAKSNITFLGYINNEKLSKIYEDHDVFVLPSISEPWGLVIDEALWFGLPVVVSENVGCIEDLVIQTGAGTTFSIYDDQTFNQALITMELKYNVFKGNVKSIDFSERDKNQIDSYLIYENTN
ncbi:glycosyltransferase family 4 protein [Vibrio splendidus]